MRCGRAGLSLFLEPADANPLLERYYQEPGKYALAMQLWILRQRFVSTVRAIKAVADAAEQGGAGGAVLDRSIYSDFCK